MCAGGGGGGGRRVEWALPFPPALGEQAAHLASTAADAVRAASAAASASAATVAFPLPSPASLELVAQGAIVNYYKGTAADHQHGHHRLPPAMGPHRDDLERTLTPPVVSISLGCAGVFLLGGRSKDERPLPVLLRSGDVVILAGESRLAYHGVARVYACRCAGDGVGAGAGAGESAGAGTGAGAGEQAVCGCEARLPPLFTGGAAGDEEADFREYIRRVRINVNVRQVVEVERG